MKNRQNGFITLPVILAVILASIAGVLVADRTGLLGSGGRTISIPTTVPASIAEGGTGNTSFTQGKVIYSSGDTLLGSQDILYDADKRTQGFASTSPYAQVSIEALQTVVGSSTPIFVIGDSGSSTPILTVDSRAGYIGISTDTPMAQFAIEANTQDGDDFYVFAVGSTGSDTPSILVQSSTGKVAMGTKKFSGSAVLQLGLTDAGTTFTSATSLLTLHNESSTNNTSAILAGRTTDGTGALAAVGRLGWQIEDHTSLSVNTDFAVSTILNGTEGEVFRVEDDGDFGVGTSTIGTGQQFAVKGAGLFKGGLYVQATTTTSSLIATSTLEVRGTATTTIGGTIAIDLAAGTSTIAGNLEITKSLRVNGAIYTNIASSTNTGTTTLIGDCSLGPKISFVLDKDARFVRKNCFGGQTQMMFIDNPPHQVGGEDHQISWEGSDGVESEAASNTLKFSKGTSTVGYITQGATNICTVIYATSSDNISIYGILECGDAGYIYR